jgi:hypothetical protein
MRWADCSVATFVSKLTLISWVVVAHAEGERGVGG